MSFVYVTLAAALGVVTSVAASYQATLANIPTDGLLDFKGLATKYGHKPVEYEITTADGYILKTFNLPGNRQGTARNEGRLPVLFVHGVFDTSDGWILRGNTSLAIMAANEGLDVWLLNFRGNRYSRRHRSLDPDSNATFWDFSLSQYATDVSANVDHVLKVTGQKQLNIVGFSEGTTATLVLGATEPEFNRKVNTFVALAPIAFLTNVRSALALIIEWSSFLDFIMPKSMQEIAGYYSIVKGLINLLCTQLPLGYEICYQGGFNALSGKDPVGIKSNFFPIVVGHFPAGTSRKNLIHFSQISKRNSFADYDYGAGENLNKYRSFTPPEYDLSLVTMSTVLVSGLNDPVSTMKDVERLADKLPNVFKHMVVPREQFNHLDHVWAEDAHTILYPDVLKMLT